MVPAQDPDWKTVAARAQELLERSKDLRVAAWLTHSTTYSQGLPGLRDGLRLLASLLDKYWDVVHPQLDAEDDNDPTMRVNALVSLTGAGMLNLVSNAPLVRSAALGAFSLRDYKIANGELPAPAGDEAPPDMSMIDGAFIDSDAQDVEATATAAREALDAMAAIEASLSQNLLPGQLPDLSPLPQMLQEINAIFNARLAGASDSDEADQEEPGVAADASAVGAAATPAQRPAGEINSREDVVRMLDKACEYYRRAEPGSPVPLLLQRAKRLVTMEFMDIMQDLAPDGADQAARACGVTSPEE